MAYLGPTCTSMAITSAITFGITSANTIMAITSEIKINLQLVVYKFYKTTQSPIHLGVYLQRTAFSFTPEAAMLVELAKVCVY